MKKRNEIYLPMIISIIAIILLAFLGVSNTFSVYTFEGLYKLVGTLILIVCYSFLIFYIIKSLIRCRKNEKDSKLYIIFFIQCIFYILLLFASIYSALWIYDINSFNTNLSDEISTAITNHENLSIMNYIEIFFHYLYFSTITLTTVGYGDTCPVTMVAKFLTSIESIISYVFISCVIIGLISTNSNTSQDSANNNCTNKTN